MKANNITLRDYDSQDRQLVLVLADTSMEAVIGMDTTLLTIQTDDGDTVEVFSGFAQRSVTCDLIAKTYTATLVQSMEDAAAILLKQLTEELLVEKEKVNKLEKANSDIMDALIELASLVTGEGEV